MKIRIILHVGLPKTGSTAIQQFLQKNKESLKNDGYYYHLENYDENLAVLDESFKTSGNGEELYIEIKKYSNNIAKLKESIIDYFSRITKEAQKFDCHTVIVSSEMLCILHFHEIAELICCLRDSADDYLIIKFYRNPYKWFFSSWLQGVKRGGCGKWIDEGLMTDPDTVLRPLCFSYYVENSFKFDNLCKLKYEDHKDHLVESFLNAIDSTLQKKYSYHIRPRSIINRSLSKYEFILSYAANKYSNGNIDLSELMSKIPDYHDKSQEFFYFWSKKTADMLIDWLKLNNPFLLLEYDIYKEAEKTIEIVDEEDFFAKQENRDLLACKYIEQVIKYYVNIYNTNLKKAQHACLFYKDSAYKINAPSDFNAFTYLVTNQDVLNQNIDPYYHYCNYGEKEKRIYNL
jgi:hypothetical protein